MDKWHTRSKYINTSGRKTGCPGEHREAALYQMYSPFSSRSHFLGHFLHFILRKSVFLDLILHLKKTGLKRLHKNGSFLCILYCGKPFFLGLILHLKKTGLKSLILYVFWLWSVGPVADLCFSSTSDKSTASRCKKY